MRRHMEHLEGRTLLAASVAADLLASAGGSLFDAAAPAAVAVAPLKKTLVVPPVGGNYAELTSRVTLNGIAIKPVLTNITVFDPITISLVLGRKGRLYGSMNWGNGYVGTQTVPLAGAMHGSNFTVRGSADDSGFVVLVTTTIKVTGVVSADGRRISGSFSVFQQKLAADESYTGRFAVKRGHG